MTMATNQEITAGANALKVYIDQMMEAAGKGWEEWMIPAETFVTGCTDVINAADRHTQTPASRQANGQAALRAALNSTGHGGDVTDAQVAGATQAVLKAIGALRGK
jgi:hypothetical protein